MRSALLLAAAVVAFGLGPAGALAQIAPAPLVVRPNPVVVNPARTCTAGNQDCDGDGARAIRYGGDDCNDNDASIHPAAVEVADANGKDEDCDPRTFGQRDTDNDGEFDARAYNVDASGRRFGGTDCNDNESRVRRLAQELPNGVDDDCNGHVDDLFGTWRTPPAR